MTIAFGLLFVVAAAAFVAAPFFTTPASEAEQAPEHPGSGSAAEEERARLERQKREAYAAIKEAEFDYRMAKLSDGDFAALRQTYENKALEAIAALDASGNENKQEAASARTPSFCASCGNRLPDGARFCPGCGHSSQDMPSGPAS